MRERSWSAVVWSLVVLCAASVACARKDASPGASATSTRTDLLLEAAGLENLRIDEATIADAASRLGLPEAETTASARRRSGDEDAAAASRPFTVNRAAEVTMARQQVISTRPETTLRISEY